MGVQAIRLRAQAGAEDHMRAAFAALLRGDIAERDRQCRLAEAALGREPVERAERSFYATGLPLIHAARRALRGMGG